MCSLGDTRVVSGARGCKLADQAQLSYFLDWYIFTNLVRQLKSRGTNFLFWDTHSPYASFRYSLDLGPPMNFGPCLAILNNYYGYSSKEQLKYSYQHEFYEIYDVEAKNTKKM